MTSQGGRHVVRPEWPAGQIFQFTTSQGGRLNGMGSLIFAAGLSIHDLTRRSTFDGVALPEGMDLSIHDLTRRSTT